MSKKHRGNKVVSMTQAATYLATKRYRQSLIDSGATVAEAARRARELLQELRDQGVFKDTLQNATSLLRSFEEKDRQDRAFNQAMKSYILNRARNHELPLDATIMVALGNKIDSDYARDTGFGTREKIETTCEAVIRILVETKYLGPTQLHDPHQEADIAMLGGETADFFEELLNETAADWTGTKLVPLERAVSNFFRKANPQTWEMMEMKVVNLISLMMFHAFYVQTNDGSAFFRDEIPNTARGIKRIKKAIAEQVAFLKRILAKG